MEQSTQNDKPSSQSIEQQAQTEIHRLETNNAGSASPQNKQGSTNEVQPIATDEGLIQ